jgi:hypothetical protein
MGCEMLGYIEHIKPTAPEFTSSHYTNLFKTLKMALDESVKIVHFINQDD